jgi:uncharacterized protein YdeI (YjbR/CyaY-like superfamily)
MLLHVLFLCAFLMKRPAKASPKSFSARLELLPSARGWTVAFVPFSVPMTWKLGGRIRVKGTINGFAFRTSLFPTKDSRHFLLINKRMQRAAAVRLGDTAVFTLEPDTAKRTASVPPELLRLLKQDRSLFRWYEQFSYSIRRWVAEWVTQPKGAAARSRRAEQVAEQFLSAMEAERDLPPFIKAAFARNPRAFAGWNKMSPTQRRGHLLAVFYYRSPEARERRLAKVLEEAHARADR